MAQPNWVTGSGSLGTIPEGKFYRATLQAYDPDFPTDATKVKFIKLSGDLPPGMQIRENGIVEGTPQTYVKGVPEAVSQNVTSKFAVRSYTETISNGSIVVDELNDRTFELTVTGQDVPEFTTNSGKLGDYYDGQLVNIQIGYTDPDPDDTVEVTLAGGELPPGITVNNTGLLYGYIDPSDDINIADDGWEQTGFDSYPLQFNQGTISKRYEFSLRLTDGKNSSVRSFYIFVGLLTADTSAFTVDNTNVTVDAVTRAPYIEDYVENLGTFKHDNYFIHQFKGADHVGDILNYSSSGSLPGGLVLDSDTGYLYGELSSIGSNETTYSFTITVYKKEDAPVSTTYDYQITIHGELNESVEWDTDADLGSMDNGSISTLSVSASSDTGVLKYKLKTGEYNKLPNGLTLNESGNIVGAAGYNMFRLVGRKTTADSATTVDTTLCTADENGQDIITFDGGTTTIDSKCRFTVQAYNDAGTVSTTKEFTLVINDAYDTPSYDILINGLLTETDRNKIDTLLNDTAIFPTSSIYRSDDPYFGLSDKLSYTHLYGLSPEDLPTYQEALEKHYDKNVVLGELKTAVAKDENSNVIYEVIYSEIQESNKDANPTVTTSAGDVYPNSLNNLRTQVIDKVGKVSSIDSFLPGWMTSVQSNGEILGYVPAWVIAYTEPGKSDSILYRITEDYSYKLNSIEFNIDRYVVDTCASRFWDTEDQRWPQYISTTFDIYDHTYSVDTDENYFKTTVDLDEITSDATLTVDRASKLLTADSTLYTADQFDNTSTKTTFDKGSMHFVEPQTYTTDVTTKTADTIDITTDGGYKDYVIYTQTEKFNHYLLFPKRDIINSK